MSVDSLLRILSGIPRKRIYVENAAEEDGIILQGGIFYCSRKETPEIMLNHFGFWLRIFFWKQCRSDEEDDHAGNRARR